MEDLITSGRLITLASTMGLILMGVVLFMGTILSVVRERIHKTLGQIWIPILVALGVIFVIMVVVMLYGVSQQYEIIGL